MSKDCQKWLYCEQYLNKLDYCRTAKLFNETYEKSKIILVFFSISFQNLKISLLLKRPYEMCSKVWYEMIITNHSKDSKSLRISQLPVIDAFSSADSPLWGLIWRSRSRFLLPSFFFHPNFEKIVARWQASARNFCYSNTSCAECEL